jgi:hypothetical protein
MSRQKIIQLDERVAKTGELSVQPIILWGARSKPFFESLSKEASSSPALEYIKNVQPTPGRTVVLIIGLGSYEYYGLNRNGDGFNEEPYKPGCSNGPGRDAWITDDELITKHYQSYEQGHVYKHHVNKDPKRAIGKVIKAFWNPYMHRVEVLEDLDNARDPELAERIADGEYPAKSMGCFPAGTRIHTDAGFKKIEDIRVGDVVLNRKGQWTCVTETHTRPYRGKLYSVHTTTGDSSATSEHPYAVLPSNYVNEGTPKGHLRRKDPKRINVEDSVWTHAECLDADDYLITPFDTTEKTTLSVPLCRLLGYYAAEGHIVYQNEKPYGVEFNHHKEDAAVVELPILFQVLCPGTSWHQRDRGNSDKAAHTYIYSAELAHLCIQHVGRYAAQKHLSLELLQQDRERQLSLLGAWINGDGGTVSTGEFYVCSCNDLLMRQAQTIGFRCGLYGNHHAIVHQPSPLVDHVTTEYRVSFARRGCNIMSPYTVKVQNRVLKSPSTGAFFIEGAVVSRIKDISVLDFDGPVYNFEVADDESYVAESHAVHNCRIKFDVCTVCGNMAPTRKQYCDHLKFEMCTLRPDGVKVGMLNPAPKFFDSSWVIRPADRTGFMLKKVADVNPTYELSSAILGDMVDDYNAKAAAAKKLAVIDKVVRGYPAGIAQSDLPNAKLIEQYTKGALPDVVQNTPKLSHENLKTLAPYNLGTTLAELSRNGILLTTPEFVSLFIEKAMPGVKIPAHVLDNLVATQAELFELYSQHPSLMDECADVLQPTEVAPSTLKTAVAALREKRSTVSDYLYRRYTPHITDLQEPPESELLEVVDPTSGRTYQTTHGAALAAHDAIAESQIKRMVGGAALLGGTYKMMSMNPHLRPFRLPIAAGLGYAGSKAIPQDMGPTYETTSGEHIPSISEFVEKQNADWNTINTLGQDYEITKQGSATLTRVMCRNAYLTPELRSVFLKASSFGLRGNAPRLFDRCKLGEDGIVDERLDFEKVSTVIGNLIW